MTPRPRSRRSFLFWLGAGLNAFGAALVGVPIVGYVFGPARRAADGRAWISLGLVETFPRGETRLATYENPVRVAWDGATAKVACWVRHIEGERFQVFAVNCAHLGCPVRWFAQSRLFMCPCHGGAYYEDGSVAAGPPPEPLARYAVRVKDAQVEIQTSPIPLTTF